MNSEKLNITYFSNQFATAQGHGIARYARELHEELSLMPSLNVTPVAAWSSMLPEDLKDFKAKTNLRILPFGRRLAPLAWTYLKSPLIEKWMSCNVDVVHALSLGYPVATRKPFVVTVHDLGPLTHPEYFTNTKPWIMKLALGQMVKQADAIICVSQSTADEVSNYVGSHIESRLHVVHEGVADAFFTRTDPACLDNLSLPAKNVPFILAAGKISPRKNVQGILKALSIIKNDIPHHLVLVGGSGWEMQMVSEVLKEEGLSTRVHFTGFVTDEQLRALYASAALYVHPSLYEGFGLTVLEAMASGTPVITSNSSSLPEVSGDAGRLVEPSNVEELAAAMNEICNDETLALSMKRAGINRAKGFKWSECAAKVSDVYNLIAK